MNIFPLRLIPATPNLDFMRLRWVSVAAFMLLTIAAIGAIVTCSAMAIFAGDIPGTLLRIPGTPASAAYTDAKLSANYCGFTDSAGNPVASTAARALMRALPTKVVSVSAGSGRPASAAPMTSTP